MGEIGRAGGAFGVRDGRTLSPGWPGALSGRALLVSVTIMKWPNVLRRHEELPEAERGLAP